MDENQRELLYRLGLAVTEMKKEDIDKLPVNIINMIEELKK